VSLVSLLGLFGLFDPTGLAWGSAAAADGRPNILLAIGDNWSSPHAGVLGDPIVRTPVFDRIAREGVLFPWTFCPVPSCSPTRSSLLTGRAAHQLEEAASLWGPFQARFRVFTDQLRDAGYEVGFTGKGWSPGRYLEYGWTQNPAGRQFASFEEFLDQRHPDKPFFFWHGSVETALHQWNYEPSGWAGLDPARLVVPPMLPDVPEVRQSMLAYYGGVERMDRRFGQDIARLEADGLLDQTVVIYTSDNGWQMPRGLANCYDTGTRVPLAVRWGTRLSPGRVVEDFISLTDLAATILELAGETPPAVMTSRSFAGLLTGQTPDPSREGSRDAPRDHVFVERERHANVRRGNLSFPIRGIRTREFLYLWNIRPDRWPAGDPQAYYAVGDYGDVDGSRAKEFLLEHASEPAFASYFTLSFAKRPAEELYDLRRDPDQLTNVAGEAEYADVRRELRGRVEQWMRDTADPRVDPQSDVWDTYPYFGGRVVDEQGNPIPRRPAGGRRP
jgi:arylsulfatase A-like enzyme